MIAENEKFFNTLPQHIKAWTVDSELRLLLEDTPAPEHAIAANLSHADSWTSISVDPELPPSILQAFPSILPLCPNLQSIKLSGSQLVNDKVAEALSAVVSANKHLQTVPLRLELENTSVSPHGVVALINAGFKGQVHLSGATLPHDGDLSSVAAALHSRAPEELVLVRDGASIPAGAAGAFLLLPRAGRRRTHPTTPTTSSPTSLVPTTTDSPPDGKTFPTAASAGTSSRKKSVSFALVP